MTNKYPFVTTLLLLLFLDVIVFASQAQPRFFSITDETGAEFAPDPLAEAFAETRGSEMDYIAADSNNVEFVGHIGGATLAVDVQGNYAYIGEGPRLTILDISDPTAPVMVGKTAPFPDTVEDVAVAGDYAYVANRYGGLRIINVANPTTPTEAGFYDMPGIVRDVAVAGDFAYVTNTTIEGGLLRIINIANPADPTEAGFYSPSTADSIAVVEDYAYVAGRGGLQIINVANPAAPTQAGYIVTKGMTIDITVAGNYAYLADISADGGLRIFNVANPAAPTEAGYYDMPGDHGGAAGVAVAGDYAYVTEWNLLGNGLRIINVGNPAAPIEIGFYDMPESVYGVVVAGDYAYMEGFLNGGLRIINVANPAAPTETGFYGMLGQAYSVTVAGDYAYLADLGGLRIINVANPTTPNEAGFYETLDDAVDVAVDGNHAYVADDEAGLRIIDIADPAAPTEIGFHDTPERAYGVTMAGNYAYMADGGGLRIINVANPAAPIETGFFDTPEITYAVAVAGDYAYMVGDLYQNGTLRIINVANPAAPTETGFFDIPETTYGVAVAGDYAYVAGRGGLRIINIANPADPNETGLYYMPEPAYGVTVVGNYAYVAGNDGLRIIDVANPADPTEAGYYGLTGSATGVAVSGGIAYVADLINGMFILRFTETGSTYSISGQITKESNVPLSGATVSLDSGKTTFSDVNGQYEFGYLPAGTYMVSASLVGYEFSTVSITVELPPDQEDIDFIGRIYDDPCKVVQGHLYGAITNIRLQGVEVTINNLVAGSATAITDENGHFVFSWNNNSPSNLSAELEGYKSYTNIVGKNDYCPTYSFAMWPKRPTVSDEELAIKFAPVWYQGVDAQDADADYITNFNFDNNWNGNDNWQNQPRFDLRAYIYYSVVETRTHYFILYADFHPRDWGGAGIEPCIKNAVPESDHMNRCHENDMEGALVAVRKLFNGQTEFEYLETVSHLVFKSYRPEEIKFFDKTHPKLAVEPLGHGVTAYENDDGVEGEWIITYKEGGIAEEPADIGRSQTVKYKLIPLDRDLWARRLDYKVKSDDNRTYDYWGYFAEDETDGIFSKISKLVGITAHPPWFWTDLSNPTLSFGDFFFDPAYVIAHEFLTGLGDFARDYTSNPYLSSKGIYYIQKSNLSSGSGASQDMAILSNDGTTTILVPPDAVDSSIVVTHELSSNEAYYDKGALATATNEGNSVSGTVSGVREIILHPLEISAKDLDTKEAISKLNKDFSIIVNYSDRDAAGFREESLQLYRWNGSSWSAQAGSSLDTEKNTVTLATSEFGKFALLGVPKHEVFMPAAMKGAQP